MDSGDFGSIITDVNSSYAVNQTASAVFNGANPRNNFRLEGTFLSVDHFDNGVWTMVRSDSHPSTTYQWARTNEVCVVSRRLST